MSERIERGGRFLSQIARPLERAGFSCLFESASSQALLDALSAHKNSDGGYGESLEPDLRDPNSHPLFVDFALKAAYQAGVRAPSIAEGVCDFLESVSQPGGSLPYLLPSALERPRAAHWEKLHPPSLELTYGIVGLLHWLGIEHSWLEAATAECWAGLEAAPPQDAHALIGVLHFLEFASPNDKREECLSRILELVPQARWLKIDPEASGYGLSPLELAPTPRALARGCFSDEVINAHLARLAAQQEPDGGWPISWDPPGEEARAEWRGKWTLNALAILKGWDWGKSP